MIIGFCGLAGSGKDTAADFMVERGEGAKLALADPLKRICQATFGFTDEQLWGPSSERNKPDKRYWRFEVSEKEIEKLTEAWHNGADAGHGPDIQGTLAEFCGLTEEEWAYYVEVGGYLTPRFALQQLGTEWGRRCYPNIWVHNAIRDAKILLESTIEDDKWRQGPPGFHRIGYSPQRGIHNLLGQAARQISNVYISDVRFLNEVVAINEAGGVVYQLLRGQGLMGTAGLHKSETEMKNIPAHLFKGIIDNRDWSIYQLQGYLSDNVGRDN